MPEPEIRAATEDDVSLLLSLIKELAEYERLSHEVVATEETLQDSLFGERRVAEAVLGYLGDELARFALFFHNFSTFLGKPGIYLEDLYVRPVFRGAGAGRAMIVHWRGWRGWRSGGVAVGWSGRYWTGTSRPSASTNGSAPLRSAAGRSTA